MAAAALLVAALVVATSVANKCCGPDNILSTDLSCVPGSDHLLLAEPSAPHAFPCKGNLSLVEPYQDMRVSCVDVMEDVNDTSLKGVVCSKMESKMDVPPVHFLRKCCPRNRRYSNFRDGCWGSLPDPRSVDTLRKMFLRDPTSAVELKIGVPECPRDNVLVDIFIHHRHVWRQESESILLKHRGPRDLLIVPEEFCVDLVTDDDYTLVVRACRDSTVTCELGNTTCINKCCPDGASYRDFKCEQSRDSFDVQFYSILPRKAPSLAPVTAVGIAYGDDIFKCTNGKFPLDPERSPEDFFLVADSGDLLVPENPMFRDLLGWKDYCLEVLEGRVVPFLCFPHVRTSGESEVHFTVIAAGLVVSGLFLLVTLLVYACLPSLHNLHGLTLMCHVASLLLAYAFLVTSQLLSAALSRPLCVLTGYGIQFCFLAAFSWLNVICFDIWWTFGAIKSHVVKAEETRRRFWCYSVYAWTVPLVITSLTFLVDFYKLLPSDFLPGMAVRYCWFQRNTHGKTIFFNLPVMIQITSNIVFFVLTSRNCSKIKSELEGMQQRNRTDAKLKYRVDKNRFSMNVKLFVVMGLTWGCEIITWYFQRGDNHVFWYLLDAANIFQGFMIFLIFVIKKKVIRAMKLRVYELCFAEPRSLPTNSSSVFTTTSSDARQSSLVRN